MKWCVSSRSASASPAAATIAPMCPGRSLPVSAAILSSRNGSACAAASTAARRRGAEAGAGRVEADVGAGRRAQEDREVLVERDVDGLAARAGPVEAERDVDAGVRGSGGRDADRRSEPEDEATERRRRRRAELRRVDGGLQLEGAAGVAGLERDPLCDGELTWISGQPEQRLHRLDQRDEPGRIGAERARVAQPARRILREAHGQADVARGVEEAERAEEGVDDRLRGLVGRSQRVERGLAEQRRRDVQDEVAEGGGVERRPQLHVGRCRGAGGAPVQRGPAGLEPYPQRPGGRRRRVGAEADPPVAGRRRQRGVRGPTEPVARRRRVEREGPGGEVGDDRDRVGRDPYRAGIVAAGRWHRRAGARAPPWPGSSGARSSSTRRRRAHPGRGAAARSRRRCCRRPRRAGAPRRRCAARRPRATAPPRSPRRRSARPPATAAVAPRPRPARRRASPRSARARRRTPGRPGRPAAATAAAVEPVPRGIVASTLTARERVLARLRRRRATDRARLPATRRAHRSGASRARRGRWRPPTRCRSGPSPRGRRSRDRRRRAGRSARS